MRESTRAVAAGIGFSVGIMILISAVELVPEGVAAVVRARVLRAQAWAPRSSGRFWVKFRLRSQQGIENLTDAEAEALVGKDRKSHQRDLYESIEKGDFPRWTIFIQVMPDQDAAKLPYHPFDLTNVWFHKDYRLIEVGVMELHRNPASYHTDVEQAAFNPANIVPGIGFSPDKMPQGRLFSYGDAQRHRRRSR